jgi:hypothetical protein
VGAPVLLATLGHGGREVGPADFCVRALGAEVSWVCPPSPLFDDGFGVAMVARSDGLRWVLPAQVCSRGVVAALLECSEPCFRRSCGGERGLACCYSSVCA